SKPISIPRFSIGSRPVRLSSCAFATGRAREKNTSGQTASLAGTRSGRPAAPPAFLRAHRLHDGFDVSRPRSILGRRGARRVMGNDPQEILMTETAHTKLAD